MSDINGQDPWADIDWALGGRKARDADEHKQLVEAGLMPAAAGLVQIWLEHGMELEEAVRLNVRWDNVAPGTGPYLAQEAAIAVLRRTRGARLSEGADGRGEVVETDDLDAARRSVVEAYRRANPGRSESMAQAYADGIVSNTQEWAVRDARGADFVVAQVRGAARTLRESATKGGRR